MPLNSGALLGWCQRETATYDGVSVENWSRSWNDGLAFCALLHRHFPDDIRFGSLNSSTPQSRARNFELAFGVAERRLDVERLFDVEDMMATYPRPDGRSVTTYVVLLYNAIEERGMVAATAVQLTPLPLPDRSEDDSALSPAELAMIRKCNQKMEALNAKLQHSPRSHVPTAEEQAMLLSMAALNAALESDARNPARPRYGFMTTR
ncbi:hypothetical protein EMIHUDRAFT_215021 [Emiliania huxleyi CCMP1516]|uniref:Calponin-homology (CH) domain-containing protein n=2 Tax=Emiliania huxleyi TaxID=2903 RepID=A0A0D3IIT0_EMIH1|nr:hypothetical protein EMIHUDRAFT_215021 [Emiliania huxleyi CCMP1516]EOD11165.1 hypothetical protein EMIHUDRAFT_215021 [Emiliania huxleyi CCMP1516]|eukprot:XP_005763594.1 hypothetical protein EMIHUDRAFT_215021 [Emiliania huxleyi CCMP1516]